MSETDVIEAVKGSPNMSEAARSIDMDLYEFKKLAKSLGVWKPVPKVKKSVWFDDDVPGWKVEAARHYYAQGLDVVTISYFTGIPKSMVEEIVMDEGIIYATALGHKSEAYYEDEMDYARLGPCAVPAFVLISDN